MTLEQDVKEIKNRLERVDKIVNDLGAVRQEEVK